MQKVITKLLDRFLTDDTAILELEKYGEEVINIALENRRYNSLVKLFKPITINEGTESYIKIFF